MSALEQSVFAGIEMELGGEPGEPDDVARSGILKTWGVSA
jgi:hypothetical protein